MKTIQTLPLIVGFSSLVSLSHASVLTTGNFNSGSPVPTLILSSDVILNIFNTGSVEFLAFDEWVISDGSITGALSTAPQNISYQINSGPITTVPLNILVDNLSLNINALTPNDGYLKFGAIAVTAGDTLTFKATSLTFQGSGANFNASLPAIFNGTALATDNMGGAIGEGRIIPEPLSALMLALALPIVLGRRSRAIDTACE